jgi:hypothetical protein
MSHHIAKEILDPFIVMKTTCTGTVYKSQIKKNYEGKNLVRDVDTR